MSNDLAKAPRLSWDAVSARRLERHGLAAPLKEAGVADIVAAMCGAHAQVMSAAELSVALRLAGATRSDVREALWTEHRLVKTFGPRGTVHLLPTRDLPMWTAALSMLPPSTNNLPEDAQLTFEQTEAVVEAIAVALEDAEMTVDELGEAVVASSGSWAGDPVVPAWYEMWPRWRPAIYTAANRGVLCYGPTRAGKVTYTNPQRWLPKFQLPDGQTALADLARRYLYAYGPATPQQFAQWMAAPRQWATELFDSLSGELEQVELDGTLAWVTAGDTTAPTKAPEEVRLLPYFDAYVVGCHPRERLFPGRASERALAGGQAGNFPVLLVDGIVAGVWHQRRSGRKLHITVEPLNALSAKQRDELDDQVQRVGEILEGRPELTIGAVNVGPHA